VQNEIQEALQSFEANQSIKLGAVKPKNHHIFHQAFFKAERISLLTYLKSLSNFFDVWTETTSDQLLHARTLKTTTFDDSESSTDENQVKDISVIFLQIWTVINHSVFVQTTGSQSEHNEGQ
jgi:hypothetical protein